MIGKWMARMAAALALVAGMAAPALAAPADEAVRSTAEKVLAEVRKAKGGSPERKEQAYAYAKEQAKALFDYEAMSRLAVGKHWRSADAAQKARIAAGLEEMLSRMYAGSLFALSDAKVSFFEAQGAGEDAQVRSDLERPGAPKTRIDYRLRNTGGAWRVYDVSVDGVSLIASQRNVFASIVAREGIDGLIRSLESKGPQTAAAKI